MDGKTSVRDAVLDRQCHGSVSVDEEPIYVTTTCPGVLHLAREHHRVKLPLAKVTYNPATWTVTGTVWKPGWGRLNPAWKDRVEAAVIGLVRARTRVCDG